MIPSLLLPYTGTFKMATFLWPLLIFISLANCQEVQNENRRNPHIYYTEQNVRIDSIYYMASFPEFSFLYDTVFAHQINRDINEVVLAWLQLRDTSIIPYPHVSWYCQLNYQIFQTSGDTLSFLIDESSQAGGPRPQFWYHSFNYVISQRKRIFLKDPDNENNPCNQIVTERANQIAAGLEAPFDCRVFDGAGTFREFVIRGDSIFFCIDENHFYHGCNMILVGFKKEEVKDCF